MLKLTPAERADLRAEAHALKPVVMIGDDGLKPTVMKEIDAGLKTHGLIKIRVFGDDREARVAMYDTICSQLHAAQVQQIGKLLVVYRPKVEQEKTHSIKVGRGMREVWATGQRGEDFIGDGAGHARAAAGGEEDVTIVKPSPSGTKRPTVSKVILKGNERVTAGGNIKRAKPRQTSAKKNRE